MSNQVPDLLGDAHATGPGTNSAPPALAVWPWAGPLTLRGWSENPGPQGHCEKYGEPPAQTKGLGQACAHSTQVTAACVARGLAGGCGGAGQPSRQRWCPGVWPAGRGTGQAQGLQLLGEPESAVCGAWGAGRGAAAQVGWEGRRPPKTTQGRLGDEFQVTTGVPAGWLALDR